MIYTYCFKPLIRFAVGTYRFIKYKKYFFIVGMRNSVKNILLTAAGREAMGIIINTRT